MDHWDGSLSLCKTISKRSRSSYMCGSWSVHQEVSTWLRGEQNPESTEGCSMCMVRKNNDKVGTRIALNKYNICKSQMGWNKVSGGFTSPCQHATSFENVRWKTLGKMVEFSNRVTVWHKVWSVKGCHCIWSGYTMPFNIRERETSYCLIRSPYLP